MKFEPKPIQIVPQTSKTIVFEKFNSQKPSLARILKLDVDENFTDKELRIISDKLEVRSFKEFVEKFDPVIYQLSYEEDGKPVFKYSLEYTEGAEKVNICKHAFYEMVEELIREKSKSGKSNLDNNYSKIEKLLSPKAELDRAKELRLEMKLCFEAAMEYQENNRDDEADRYFDKCEKLMDETVQRYKKSAVSLLPLAIADMQDVINGKLIALPEKNDDVTVVSEKTPERLLCKFEWNDKGEFEAVPVNSISEDLNSGSENNVSGYLADNWEATADEIETISNSESMKKMFLRCYSEEKTTALSLAPIEELVEKQRAYIDIYKDAQQSFMDSVGELVQKVINIEMFFKHAADKSGELPSNAKLVIANATVDEVLKQENKLRMYLNAVSGTSTEKIWFSILPPIDGEEKLMDEVKSSAGGRLKRPGMRRSSESMSYNTETSFSSAKALISLLREYKIISFFNFRANEKTGFSGISESVIETYKEAVDTMPSNDKKFSVIAYPNFNIIPKSERKIRINSKISGEGFDPIEENFLRIPVVYVDAAYIAAGTIVATQNAKILKSKGYKICDDNPCVRFDIEKGDNIFKFKTIFNCEQEINRISDTNKKINENMLGICFSDDTAVNDGSKVTNTYIKFARTCAGKPLYNTLTMVFVGQYFSVFSKKDQIISMVNRFNEYCKDQSLEMSDCDNRLLIKESSNPENIEFDTAENKIIMKFDKAIEYVDDLPIEDSSDN